MQSEQTRQSKRERRRLKREQKQRSVRAAAVHEGSADLRTTIFEVLVDYAGPLIDAIPDDADLERTEELLLFAAVVWNAVIEEDGDAEEAARKLIVDVKSKVLFPPSDAFVKWLAHRKASLFGDDHRLIRGPDLAREVESMWDVVTGVSEEISDPLRGFDRPPMANVSRVQGSPGK